VRFCQLLQGKQKDIYKINNKVLHSKSMKLYSHTEIRFRGTSTQLALSDDKTIKDSRTVT